MNIIRIFVIVFFIAHNLVAQEIIKLSLVTAEQMALKQNTEYLALIKNVEMKKSQYLADMTPYRTEVGVEYEQVPPGMGYTNYAEKRAYISQSFEFPSQYVFLHKILKAEIAKERFTLELGRRELIFTVKQSYYNLSLKLALKKLAVKNVRLAREFYEKSEAIYRAGEGSYLNLLNARVNFHSVQEQLKANEKDIEAAAASLRAVLGIENQSVTFSLSDSLTDSVIDMPYDTLRQRLSRHPNIQAASAQELAALNEKRYVAGAFLPDISVNYFSQQVDDEKFWGGEIGLSLPLLFWGQTARVQEKSAQLNIARYDLMSVKIRLQKELDEAFAEYQKASSGVYTYQNDILPEASEILRVAQASFAAGEVGYLEYLNGQQIYVQSQTEYLNALYSQMIAKFWLEKIAGVD